MRRKARPSPTRAIKQGRARLTRLELAPNSRRIYTGFPSRLCKRRSQALHVIGSRSAHRVALGSGGNTRLLSQSGVTWPVRACLIARTIDLKLIECDIRL